jgi:hypothetical protein
MACKSACGHIEVVGIPCFLSFICGVGWGGGVANESKFHCKEPETPKPFSEKSPGQETDMRTLD